MTTNIDRVADVIYRETGDSYLVAQLTQALAAAGLLAPDPVDPEGTGCLSWGTIVVWIPGTGLGWSNGTGLYRTNPAELRHEAACLLSAAAYAEEHTDDQ